MANLGLPYLSIEFREQGIARIDRSKRSVVALVLQDPEVSGQFELYSLSDIPKGLTEKNKEQITLAFMGYVHTPRKIELVVEQSDSAEKPKFDVTSPGFIYLESVRWDYLAVPFADTEDTLEIATWVKALNTTKRKMCKFVGANVKSDCKKIINFTNKTMRDVAGKEYDTASYTARIAGLLAGTPPQISCTYAPLPELTYVEPISMEDREKRVNAGEFILFDDGRKIKVQSGNNSLITTNEIEGPSFRKIKIVEIMDFMTDDITTTAEDSYLGKYANTYNNKLLLCSAIKGYMEVLEQDDLLARGSSKVEIDIEATAAFLKSMGFKMPDGRTVDEMETFEIREADTKDHVFIRAWCKILDAIEKIEIRVEI